MTSSRSPGRIRPAAVERPASISLSVSGVTWLELWMRLS